MLLVEDEKPLLEKISGNVNWEEYGYEVFIASSGEEALEVTKRVNVDILVTDIKMSGISGIDLIEMVTRNGKNEDLVSIIISGYAEFEYARKSIQLNVTDYILKPFKTSRLVTVVNNARDGLKKRRMEKEALNRLKEELSSLVRGKLSDNIYEILFNKDYNNLYTNNSLLLQHEKIFENLKRGKEEDIINSVEALFVDIKKQHLDIESLSILLHNIILLTFKSVKEMGFDLKEVLGQVDLNYGFREKNDFDFVIFKKWVEQFLLKINNHIINRISGNTDLILKIKEVVNKNLSQGITLSELADRFNMSTSNLSQLFYKHSGKNFSEYLDNVRMSKAKELLKSTSKKIYEIASDVGFDDPYYFSAWFKKKAGVSPTTYRSNFILLDN